MKKQTRSRVSDEQLNTAITRALERNGWAVPTDEDAVAAAEAASKVGGTPVLPDRLRADPRAALAAADAQLRSLVRGWHSGTVENTLARAAREGGRLSADVEKAMNRDRRAAETEAEGGDDATGERSNAAGNE